MELSERYIQTFENEGFLKVYELEDEANAVYPEHKHKGKVSIYLTDGIITFTINGESKVLSPGQRFNIPADTLHSVKIGETRAIYIVGEMENEDS